MREEPALTRDRILSYSLTAPVIDNVRAVPAVTGVATATGARAAAVPGVAGTGAAAAIGAATGAAATGAAVVECTNNKRDHHTLLHLIKQHVNPGTIILTDKWRGYNALGRHGFTHLVVNHRAGFVDPITGVHTNACEGMWFHAKRHMRQGFGRTRRNSAALSVALCEFVWLKKNQLTRSDASVRRSVNSEMPQLMRRILN